MLISLATQAASLMHASSLTTSMINSTTALAAAQANLANLLGSAVGSINTESVARITNNTDATVYIALLDANKNQINPTNIPVASGDFSYIPGNASFIKVLSNANEQLIAPTGITSTQQYSLTKPGKTWSMSSIVPSSQFTYTNSTNVPLLITLKSSTPTNTVKSQYAKLNPNNEQTIQQLVTPGQSYVAALNPANQLAVKVHADLGIIYQAYNPELAAKISLDQHNQLILTQASGSNKNLVNNSGWPMLINAELNNSTNRYSLVAAGAQYTPSPTTVAVTIIPYIANQEPTSATTKSCKIKNNGGQLAVEFA